MSSLRKWRETSSGHDDTHDDEADQGESTLREDLRSLREVDALLSKAQREEESPSGSRRDGKLLGGKKSGKNGFSRMVACFVPKSAAAQGHRLSSRLLANGLGGSDGSSRRQSSAMASARASLLAGSRTRGSSTAMSEWDESDIANNGLSNYCERCGASLSDTGKCPECGWVRRVKTRQQRLAQEQMIAEAIDADEEGSRLSVTRRARMRRATLAKLEGTLKQAAQHRVNTMDAGYQRRLEEARRTVQVENTQKRLHRANTLRQEFFRGEPMHEMLQALRATSAEANVFSELRRDESAKNGAKGHARTLTQSSVGVDDLVDVPEEDEALYNRDIDQYLAASLEQMRRNKAQLDKGEKQLQVAKIKHIKVLRTNLLNEQAKLIANVRAQSKAVIKGLRKHVTELTHTIKKKLREEDDQDSVELEQLISGVNAMEATFARSMSNRERASSEGSEDEGLRVSGDDEDDAFEKAYAHERERVNEAQQILQQRFEARLGRLQEELATTVGHLNELELEQYYPKAMNWKVRLNSGDGMFIGMRDVDLEVLDADVEMGRGDELGTVNLNVTNIKAIVGIYQFSIDGSTMNSKLLRGLLTPTVNRLDLELDGTWRIKLRFQPGATSADHRPKWIKETSHFELHLTKEMAGASLVRLPDRIVRWLTTQLIPQVISNAIMLNLPTRLGAFFQHPQNYLRLQGQIKMRGEIPPRVWTAPLVAPTASGELARRAMGLTSEEAVLLDLLLRGDLATTAGFHRKGASIYRLYKWRLQYASIPLSRLGKILSEVQSDRQLQNHVENSEMLHPPDGWLLQLVTRVCELARKPISFDLDITDVEADINVQQMIAIGTGMYIDGLEHDVEVAIGKRAKFAAQKKIKDAKVFVANIERIVENTASILSDHISMDLRAGMTGGLISGILMAHVSNLIAQLRLPPDFEWAKLMGETIDLSKGYNLVIKGQAGPGDSEYTLSAKHRFVDPNEYPFSIPPEEDGRATIRDVQLNLFQSHEPAGSVRLTAESIRASLYMATLGEMTYSSPEHDTTRSAPGPDFEASLDTDEDPESQVEDLLNRSRALVSGLWARYQATQEEIGMDTAVVEEIEHPSLPNFMTSEKHDLFFDIRGIKVEAIREIGVDQKETIRVTMRSSVEELDPGSVIATAHLRFNLAELFE